MPHGNIKKAAKTLANTKMLNYMYDIATKYFSRFFTIISSLL